LRAISQSGGTKAIQVRQRRDGMLDVFLLDLKPADLMSRMKPAGAGSYYVSDNSGRLVRSAYFDNTAEPINDAQEKFKKELDYWQRRRQEKLQKSPAHQSLGG
jgi:hypothetical protein